MSLSWVILWAVLWQLSLVSNLSRVVYILPLRPLASHESETRLWLHISMSGSISQVIIQIQIIAHTGG
jgi:hypothetical protein